MSSNKSSGEDEAHHLFQLGETQGEGRFSRVLDGVFHTGGDKGTDDDDDTVNSKDVGSWCDMGPLDEKEWVEHIHR